MTSEQSAEVTTEGKLFSPVRSSHFSHRGRYFLELTLPDWLEKEDVDYRWCPSSGAFGSRTVRPPLLEVARERPGIAHPLFLVQSW